MMSLNTVVPTDVDVLSGPQAIIHKLDNHPGNQQFRLMIQSNKGRYQTMTNRTMKTLMIEEIICSVLDNGGRFLIFNGVEWSVMSRRRITDKIGHALRCGKVRRNSKKKAATSNKGPSPVPCHVIPDETKTEPKKSAADAESSMDPLRIFSENNDESNNSLALPLHKLESQIQTEKFDLSFLHECESTTRTGCARRVSATISSEDASTISQAAAMPAQVADASEPPKQEVEIDLALLREPENTSLDNNQSPTSPVRRVSAGSDGEYDTDMLASIEEIMIDGECLLESAEDDLTSLLRLPILEMR